MALHHLLSNQEKIVAELLLHDLEKSGIQMNQNQKNQFIQLNDQIRELGYLFLEHSSYSAQSHVNVKNTKENTQGIPLSLLKQASQFYNTKDNSYKIPVDSSFAKTAYVTCRNENVRRDFYMSFNSASSEQIHVLESLLKTRVALAKLLGKRSYGDLFLQDKMAKTPENTLKFLKTCSQSHLPRVKDCLGRLESLKKSHTQNSNAILQPWDIPFYSQLADANPSLSISLSHYFSLGRVMEGLSNILTELFIVISFNVNQIKDPK